jgi:hypothetical protein
MVRIYSYESGRSILNWSVENVGWAFRLKDIKASGRKGVKA